jgi:hypothetical protein
MKDEILEMRVGIVLARLVGRYSGFAGANSSSHCLMSAISPLSLSFT